ncbi:prenyltransferase [Caloramator australicus]|uniref:1,4-dihydroxy-2-naphthoate octaprenyltransferase n=2 Tax=Caloramator TaxID=44258 RepID=I7K5X5_9CLOT|nr:prenyltransferase [Caloramator australicus]CCJ32934.1 1,4-dihydroxy-2-naphthoate octaprenyltransferase [Caloramator australicus RC3]
MSRFWKGFWQLADPKIWIASTIPMLVGATFAYVNEKSFNFLWFLLALIGVYLIEIGKNAVNEVVDYITGADRFVTQDKRTPFSGGKKTIVDGVLTLEEAKWIGIVTIFLACIIGIIIALYWEIKVLSIGVLGVFFAVFYILPPLKLAYRGLGEFAVGFTFGILVTLGMYVTMTHNINWNVVLISLPLSFLITNVLWINQFPDYEADMKANKRNWVVRLGKEKSVGVYAMLFAFSYISFILISIILKNYFFLLGFITLPLTISAVKNAKKHYNDIQRLILSNAKTVQIYILTGIFMIIAIILQ